MAVKSKQLLSNLKDNMENVAEMIALVLVCKNINMKKVFDRRVSLSTLKNMLHSGLIQNVNTLAETIF